MRVVFQYDLMIVDEQEVKMPIASDFLSVGWKSSAENARLSTPVLYVRMDPAGERVPRKIFLVGTGQEVPGGLKYINSLKMPSGAFALHWFAEMK